MKWTQGAAYRANGSMLSLVFAGYHALLGLAASILPRSMQAMEESKKGKIDSPVPWKRVLLTIAVLVGVSFIPIPHPFGVQPQVDSGIWVAALSFDGACALGVIGVSQWLTSTTGTVIFKSITNAIEFGAIPWDAKEITFDDLVKKEADAVRAENEMSAARMTFSSVLYLVVILILFPIAIWLNAHWRAAVLCASLVWLLGIMWRYIFVLILAFQGHF